MRLVDLLDNVPVTTLERLLATRGARLDPKKILSPAEQTARALAPLGPKLLGSLTASARDSLDRLAPSPGRRPLAEMGTGARQLLDVGLAFEVENDLVCPSIFRVQLPATRREDPRGARALLSVASDETVRTLREGGALRGQVSGLRALVLAEVLEQLEDAAQLANDIALLPLAERLALSAIEARGSEVNSADLLALAREPARWETRGTIPKRGPAHALLSHGHLFPVGHDRFALPTEVAVIAGKERREVLERRRRALLADIESADDEPARAELARDPSELALALLIELGPGKGSRGHAVRKTDLARAARALDVSPERAEVLVTLARTLSPFSLRIADVGPRLVASWRQTALVDESSVPSAQRASDGPSGVTVVRALVLDALASLPRGRFVAIDDVVRAARADLRGEGIEAGLRTRGAAPLDEVIDRIARVSLPALGLVDVARDGTLRLASRAAGVLAGTTSTVPRDGVVEWSERRARFGAGVDASVAISLASVARASVDDALVLSLDATRARPLSVDPSQLSRALERAACPEPIARSILEALPRAIAIVHATKPARWVAIDDPALRAQLLDDPDIAREVVAGGPAGGLLIHGHGSFPRIARLFAKHGIDLRDLP